MPKPPVILLIMGVAGSGKSTIGRSVADRLGWPYFEADDFHSAANKAKMAGGVPLNDDDRAPWLAAIRHAMDESVAAGRSAVFTCSALKNRYREQLAVPGLLLVHLQGDYATILERVGQRAGHYMKPEMVRSQFDALEAPSDALVLDIKHPPEQLVGEILAHVQSR